MLMVADIDAIRYLTTHDNAFLRYFEGHEAAVTCLEMHPGSDKFISCSKDNTVRLWNAKDGSCVTTFNEHSDNVTTVLFSPIDGTLVSGSHDGTVRIHPLTTV